ncbi:MAG: hypothetical protein GKR94_14490 [Gammaproteobacteria bacterium]|nr:hypothetical protein [Gammaproteobacteria bacterium]
MMQQARARVDWVSRNLDRRLFDERELVAAFKNLAFTRRHLRVRMVVMDTGPLVRQDHRLVSLVKRLPTYFSIRGPNRDHKHFNASLVIIDRTGYIYRPHSDLYAGQVCFNDPVRAGELTRQFDEIWEAGQPDVNLRQMTI